MAPNKDEKPQVVIQVEKERRMDTRKIANEYRISHWAKVIREQKESGLNIKEFCKGAGFHENTYHYWQRKLRESACNELLITQQTQKKGESIPAGWAKCEVPRSEPGEKTINIEIGKSRIKVREGTDQELLAKVCRMLVEIC